MVGGSHPEIIAFEGIQRRCCSDINGLALVIKELIISNDGMLCSGGREPQLVKAGKAR
jgi:hypothetical protein